MAQAPIRSLDKLKGVTLEGLPAERTSILKLLNATLPIASELLHKAATETGLHPVAVAASAAFQSVTALLSAAGPKCNLANPPKEIEAKVDGNGDMVYRCLHTPAHEWDLNGKRRP